MHMKTYRVAILGATGAVGQEMLRILAQQDFPIHSLRLLASRRSKNKKVPWKDQFLLVEEVNEHSFDAIDIVLCAADNAIAKRYIPLAVASGAKVIDNSSAYRMDPMVPLIIPEVNASAIKDHHGILANPNCATIIALVALAPLHAYASIQRIIVSTYQAVSGAGKQGVDELKNQMHSIEKGIAVKSACFNHQIAYNLIPQIGEFDCSGNTSEEVKMENESRKILNAPALEVQCTCVRVPIMRSHSEAIYVEFENKIDVIKARSLLKKAPGVKLIDDIQNNLYPMPLDSSDQDLVYVGRVRKGFASQPNALSLWCCGDQIRKGAATNAVQIAQHLIKK